MPQFVGALSVPPVSEEFLNSLQAAFPAFQITPGFDRDAAVWSAGEQAVITWIKHHARQGRTVTGEPAALREVLPTGAIVRLGT